jgi:hypothetical protein
LRVAKIVALAVLIETACACAVVHCCDGTVVSFEGIGCEWANGVKNIHRVPNNS